MICLNKIVWSKKVGFDTYSRLHDEFENYCEINSGDIGNKYDYIATINKDIKRYKLQIAVAFSMHDVEIHSENDNITKLREKVPTIIHNFEQSNKFNKEVWPYYISTKMPVIKKVGEHYQYICTSYGDATSLLLGRMRGIFHGNELLKVDCEFPFGEGEYWYVDKQEKKTVWWNVNIDGNSCSVLSYNSYFPIPEIPGKVQKIYKDWAADFS